MNLQIARYLAGAAIALVAVSLVALVSLVVLRGGVSMTAPSVVALLGFVSTLIGILTVLFQNGQIASALNGHLQQHVADAEARGAAQAPAAPAAPAPAPPADTPPPAGGLH